MAHSVDRLTQFKPNWTKCLHAIHLTEDVLRPVVQRTIEKLHKTILQDVRQMCGRDRCTRCDNGDIKKASVCPENDFCNNVVVRLEKCHRSKRPYLGYVDVKSWIDDSWQFAKTFMTSRNSVNITCANDTDLAGLLSVILNCKLFTEDNIIQGDMTSKENAFFKAKEIRNVIMHWTSGSDVDDITCASYIQGMCNLLRDVNTIESRETENIKDAIQRLEQIKVQQLEMNLTDADWIKQQAKRNLQHYLADLYEKLYSQSPLSEEVPHRRLRDIRHLYVPPTMYRVDLETGSTGDKVDSYRGVFHKDKDGQRMKRVYIAGDAGCGKTTFGRRLAMTWCSVIGSEEDNDGSVNEEDVDVMKTFDYLFLVSLRFVALGMSSVTDMVKQQLFGTKTMYHGLVDSLFQDDATKCLVLLDGLDEWKPPSMQQSQISRNLPPHGIPFIHPLVACTVVTLTRPWRLEQLSLGANFIDQQIQLYGFDDEAAFQFTEKLVTQLNKVFKKEKQAKDFNEKIKQKHLMSFKTVPIILKQLICYWHDDQELGSTKCEIFSGVIDSFLKIADLRYTTITGRAQQASESDTRSQDLPPCLVKMKKYITFKSLLLTLAEMAFETLFSKDRENALVFEHDTVLKYLSQEEEKHCFDIGILTANEIVKGASAQYRCVSFLHKTFQEFLAALHIALSKSGAYVEERVAEICDGDAYDLVDVLQEMFNVFVFLGGLNIATTSAVCNSWLGKLSNSQRMESYRTSSHSSEKYLKENNSREVKLLNRLAIQCMSETMLSESPLIFKLSDIFIKTKELSPEECRMYKILVSENRSDLQSLFIETSKCLPESLLLELSQLAGLRRVHLNCGARRQLHNNYVILACQLLRSSSKTLESLQLFNFNDSKAMVVTHTDDTREKLNDGQKENDSATAVDPTVTKKCKLEIAEAASEEHQRVFVLNRLSEMCNLTSLTLSNVSLSEPDVRQLFTQLETMKLFLEISIRIISLCSRVDSEGLFVNFAEHRQLQYLYLSGLPIKCLHIYTDSITVLGLLLRRHGKAIVNCSGRFDKLRVLETDVPLRVQMENKLTVLDVLRDCSQLNNLTIYDADISTDLRLSDRLTQLKEVYFNDVTMTRATFERFVESIVVPQNQSVEVECLWLNIKSESGEPATEADVNDICDFIRHTFDCKWTRKIDSGFSCEFFIRNTHENV